MTSNTQACEAIRAHHRLLSEHLGEHVRAVTEAVAGGRPHEPAVAGLVAYLAEEVLPHAVAEEQTIYRAAAAQAGLAGTVSLMTGEHSELTEAAARLAGLPGGTAAAEQAQQLAALFATHVSKENDVLLPALAADADTDLTALLADMHHRTEEAGKAAGADEPAAGDSQAVVLSLLLQAAGALARAGHADRACRLAASAWAALRGPRPDLAVRVTAALHGLARAAGADPLRAAAASDAAGTDSGTNAGTATGADPDLDVRDLPPAQRHESIFAAYQAIQPGNGFVLINDHDPKPLQYQFEAEHSGQFTWQYLEKGPQVWRVRIGRPATLEPAGATPGSRIGTGEPPLDVRLLPHFQRHDAIFTAYRALAPGAGFVLINDHDPVPLRYQFEAQYSGQFTWDYLQSGPAEWHVRIGRAAVPAEASA